jgi:predicted secreted hydrolase
VKLRSFGLILGVFLASLTGCDQPVPPDAGVTATLHQSNSTGFDRALAVRPFQFPADHGPHPNFRDEWWYVTGNLDGPNGRRFGFQITFFRHGIRRGKRPGESQWAGQDAWMAHLALTDVANQQYHSFQRISREAIGLAGARAEPFKVWLDDWVLEASGGEGDPWHFKAQQEGVELDLMLKSGKAPVLQGDRGLSQKSMEPGNASYYYSMTRMSARGRVRLKDEVVPVSGLAWLDREWSTSMLAQDQAGWDWFSLQLDSGEDLMYFRMRRKNGEEDPLSSGAWIPFDGTSRHLNREDVKLTSLSTWGSPAGYDYPTSWQLSILPTGLKLVIKPVLADQEFRHDARYWEGAVDVTDAETGQRLGKGYVELTGYAPGAVEKATD